MLNSVKSRRWPQKMKRIDYFCPAMNKFKFKILSISISGILVCLAGLQIFWLLKMYESRKEEFNQKVNAAIEQSAFQELTQRKAAGPTVTGIINLSDLKASVIRSISITDSTANDPVPGDNRTITGTVAGKPAQVHTFNYTYDIKRAPDRKNIHITKISYAIEEDYRIIAKYDTLLTQNLKSRDITAPHRIWIYGGEKDSAIGPVVTDPLRFTLPVRINNRNNFTLEIENPHRQLLREMAGIITSSLLILCILVLSFYYLLRTIFRQKNLEELKSDFTRNITHELKTPISVASAANEALLQFSAYRNPQKRDEYLNITRQQLGLLSDMVERILSITRQEQENYNMQVSGCNIKELLSELVQNYTLAFADKPEKKITFNLDIDSHDPVFYIDRFHFTHVLSNLIDNAIKYSGEEVVIEIKAGGKEISVTDNGIGIPSGAARKVFDKFYRVPTGNLHNVKGFGLGLYYTRLIVEKHGGTIELYSRPGHGSTFKITLP